jgi:hypothetical protein
MRFTTLFAVAATTLVASFASAQAQQVQVGVLECAGPRNVGYVVGSQTELNCVFNGNGMRPEPYVAVIHRVGLDLGFTEQSGLAWGVFAPSQQIGRGALAGHFGGVGANASVGVGFGGNLMVGGSSNAYALQPLSLQGQTGLNVTAGIAEIELHPVVAVRHGRRHHRRHHG